MDHSAVIAKVKPSIATVFAFTADNELAGHGTGFVFGTEGTLVTCNHVLIGDQDTIIKFFDSKEPIKASVAMRDIEHDLAILKFTPDKTRVPLELAPAKEIKEGMGILLPGYPLQFVNFLTHQGIISGIIKDAKQNKTYVLDATIHGGNSGGPMLNNEGKLCGVVNAKRRNQNELLEKVEKMPAGSVSLHGEDIVQIYQAVIGNAQLGMGYAVPAEYIPYTKTDGKK